MNKQLVEGVPKRKKGLFNACAKYCHEALLFPDWVGDNVSTVQRTDTNEVAKGLLDCHVTTYEAPNRLVNYQREMVISWIITGQIAVWK